MGVRLNSSAGADACLSRCCFALCPLIAIACGNKPPPTVTDLSEDEVEARIADEVDLQAGQAGQPEQPEPLPVCSDGSLAMESSQPRVVLNEIFAGELIADRADWFELRNVGNQVVSLAGWSVEDYVTGDAPKDPPGHYEFGPEVMLCPDEYLVVHHEEGCDSTVDAFDFGIGDTDMLVLRDADGTVVDEAAWTNLPRGQSIGWDTELRAFAPLANVTEGGPNSEPCDCCVACRHFGLCSLRDGSCIADSESMCIASLGCEQLGQCSLSNDRCVASSAAECAASVLCEELGKCAARRGKCVAASDEQCRASEACENDGRCTADTDAGSCVATSDADCAHSDNCQKLDRYDEVIEIKNRCVLQGDSCVATSCGDTTVCAEKGCCTLLDGKCVRVDDM